MDKREVGYYLVKDLSIVSLFSRLVRRREECREDFINFIDHHAPGSHLHVLRTDGNMQIRFMSYTWRFNKLKHITKDVYKDVIAVPGGFTATLDITNPKGKQIREEQMELLSSATAYCYELWGEEIAPVLGWDEFDEPALMYDKVRRIYIFVSNKIRPHGDEDVYRPPMGIIKITKDKAHDLLSTIA